MRKKSGNLINEGSDDVLHFVSCPESIKRKHMKEGWGGG